MNKNKFYVIKFVNPIKLEEIKPSDELYYLKVQIEKEIKRINRKYGKHKKDGCRPYGTARVSSSSSTGTKKRTKKKASSSIPGQVEQNAQDNNEASGN